METVVYIFYDADVSPIDRKVIAVDVYSVFDDNVNHHNLSYGNGV